MRFLLDTNIISAFLKGDGRVFNHFIQHSGGLSTSVVCAGELYFWVYRAKTAPARLRALEDVLSDLFLLPVDQDVARKFGEVRAALLDHGHPTPEMDLLIACTALTHDLTLVTGNLRDFAPIPNLRLENWLP
jgi:tRNA(fMet)-specific endonuclease VapC